MTAHGERLRFDVHPSVVFQLGADLVTDDMQALIELVKNAYDAGATYAKVEIETKATARDAFSDTFYSKASGYIKITDDGEGMDISDIKGGWMVVASSPKRHLKDSGKLAKKRRVPLGDKGLGRLGSQLLGRNVEVITARKKSGTEEHLGFAWEDFKDCEALGKVPVKRAEPRPAHRAGTMILISDLINPQRWSHDKAKEELEDRLVELISPFEGVEAFDLLITVNGFDLELAEITKKLRREAELLFTIEFDGERMNITGRVKLGHLKPTGHRAKIFVKTCEHDSGGRFLDHLKRSSQGKMLNLRKSRSSGWFAEFSQSFSLNDQDGVTQTSSGIPANPGRFRGEVDSFSLASGDISQQAVFSSASEYRRYISTLAGIRIYRDGFGIRVDRDFLQLGRQTTRGRSWYGLRPGNIIGYLALSARENRDLEETADREGFKDTPHYRNFRLLLDRFVDFTATTLSFLRRNTNAFCDNYQEKKADVPPSLSPDDLVKEIGQELDAVAKIQKFVRKSRDVLAAAAEELDASEKAAASTIFSSEPEFRDARAVLDRIQRAVENAQKALSDAQGSLDRLGLLHDRYNVLQAHLDQLNERLLVTYETMSLGLTAEALAHEIRFITDGIATRSSEIARYVNKKPDDGKTKGYIRHVRAATAALRKQLAHLDPSLKYAREQREVFDLFDFLEELQKHHEGRWRKRVPISCQIDRLRREQFTLKVNRGKMTQIFDNLVLNSEYWLREDLRLERITHGEIVVELQMPYVWLKDNGRGIDPSVEDSLFEAFVTAKAKGRGLGLFLVRELLQSEGCTIDLHPDRNERDRLYLFQLDLSGVLHGEEEK